MKEKIKKLIPVSILQKIRRIDYIILYKYYSHVEKQNKNKILFLSDSRDDLTGNFSFIYKELKKYNFELNLFLKKTIDEKKKFKEKKRLCKLIATAKFILVDDFYPIVYVLKLRKNTELIQVWHAMGAFKKVGYSRMGKIGGPEKSSLTHKNYTAAIVSSEAIKKDYAEAFSIDISKIHSVGIPRTDIFFNKKYKEDIKRELYIKYPILKNKKVILFAPTFRGNGQSTAYYDFSLINFEKIKQELEEEYVLILKIHPFVKDLSKLPQNDNFYLNLSSEREINDLLFITDTLITDYSSVIFENSLLNNRVIFFVPDLDDYIATRDFYYDFSKYAYGDITTNMNELIKSIKSGKTQRKKLEEFKKYFCSSCNGDSTKKFVDELIIKKQG